jgi:probable rRNA maturation factor
MQEHPLIELYVSVGDYQQNTTVEQLLATLNLDKVVLRTLYSVGITQKIMLTLLVTDDDGIRDMNLQYRSQNKPTDVLSFPLLDQPLVQAPAEQLWPPKENPEGKAPPAFVSPPSEVTNLGDIVMSWPTVIKQATEQGHDPRYELLYLLAHGVLHLVGYDDHTEAGYQAMVGLQQRVLESFGYKI